MIGEFGRWEFDPKLGSEVWQGPRERIERHGPAALNFFLDRQRSVDNCLLPDGNRGVVSASFSEKVARGAQPSVWRVKKHNGVYCFGRIEISPGVDIAFIEDESLGPKPLDPEGPDKRFASDILGDARIRELVQSDDFASEFYAAMCNITWRRREGLETWTCSFRASAAFVAELRGRSEEYIDFYLSELEGTVSARVEAELARLGWYPHES